MKFADAEAEQEFSLLPQQMKTIAEEFDLWCLRNNMGQAIVTDIGRAPSWYARNGLLPPSFSWHYVHCAIDFRNKHLTDAQRQKAERWIRTRCDSRFEVVLKDHGTAPHFHLAYRDFSRRAEWERKKGEGQ